MSLSEDREEVKVDIQEQFRCKICSENKCQKCRKELRSEKIGYSIFLAGIATGAILSSVFLSYLTPGVFISSGFAVGVAVKSIYEAF